VQLGVHIFGNWPIPNMQKSIGSVYFAAKMPAATGLAETK